MTQNKEKEANCKVIDLMLYYLLKDNELSMKALDNRIKFLQNMMTIELDNEPLSFFKKKHKAWEEKIEDLEEQLFQAHKSFEDVFEDIVQIQTQLNGDTKKEDQH